MKKETVLLIVISVLTIGFLAMSIFALKYFWQANACVKSPIVWCPSNESCTCEDKSTAPALNCAMNASIACSSASQDNSTMGKKYLSKYPNIYHCDNGEVDCHDDTGPCVPKQPAICGRDPYTGQGNNNRLNYSLYRPCGTKTKQPPAS